MLLLIRRLGTEVITGFNLVLNRFCFVDIFILCLKMEDVHSRSSC